MKKTTILNFLLLIIFSFTFSSCSIKNEQEKQMSFTVLNAEKAIDNSQAFDPAEKFAGIEFIPLENKENVLLGDVLKIIKSGGFFYLYDASGNLFSFNEKGKFAHRIGKMGNGPEEYNVIADFTVDETNNRVIVNSFGKLLFYTTDGEYVKTEKTDANNQVMDVDSEGRIFYILPDDAQPEGATSAEIIKVTNSDGSLIKTFTTTKIRHSGLSYFNTLSRKNETLFYKEETGDVIYSINPVLEKDSVFRLILGKYAFTEPDFTMSAMEKWNSLYRFDRIFIGNDLTVLNLQKGLIGKDIYPLIWDGKNLIFPHDENNPLQQGLYYHGIRITPMTESNNEIVCLASLMDILEKAQKGTLKDSILAEVSESSNPVLCVLKN